MIGYGSLGWRYSVVRKLRDINRTRSVSDFSISVLSCIMDDTSFIVSSAFNRLPFIPSTISWSSWSLLAMSSPSAFALLALDRSMCLKDANASCTNECDLVTLLTWLNFNSVRCVHTRCGCYAQRRQLDQSLALRVQFTTSESA